MLRIETKDGSFSGDYGASVDLEVKAVTEDGEFEGYGSIFEEKDSGGDIVMPGAFTESLKAIPAAKIKMFWQHDSSKIIGRFSEAYEDKKGLFVKGKLNKTQQGQEALELLRDGSIDGLSIGYRTDPKFTTYTKDARILNKLELPEVSIVTFPMNKRSLVLRVKSGALPTERELEDMLKRDAGLSSRQAKAFIAGGFKTMTAVRDAGVEDDEQAGLLSALADLTARLRA